MKTLLLDPFDENSVATFAAGELAWRVALAMEAHDGVRTVGVEKLPDGRWAVWVSDE
jgi:hypothetical protein